MSDVSEHSDSEFYFPKKKKKEKRGGHMIKCLLTELGRAGRENIWPVRPSYSVHIMPANINSIVLLHLQ